MGRSSVTRSSRWNDSAKNFWMSYSLVAAVAHAAPDFLEGGGGDRVHLLAGGEMGFDLFVEQRGLEARDQVGGADDVLAKAADQFHRAGVHQRDGEHDVVRRVLHGEVAVRRQHGLEIFEQLLPARVLALGAGQGVEMAGLDAVHQLARLALGGHNVIPAPCDHQVLGKSEHAIGNGVAVVVVVKQPRIDFLLVQGGLNGGEVHGQKSIVADALRFPRILH